MIGSASLCRRLALPLAGMIAFVFAPGAHAEEPLPTPEARSLSLIAWPPKGWVIDIEKDGSGVLRYGLGEVAPAIFPAGTVSFLQVLEWAETRREVARGNPECVIAVIDRSAPEGKEDLSEKCRAMSGDLETIARQILPHLQSRDVEGTFGLLRAHPLLLDSEGFNFTKVVKAPPPSAPEKAEQAEAEPAVEVEMMRSVSDWDLSVYRDGSGSIRWGSIPGDFASFPKGTVAFEELVAAARSSRLVGQLDPQAVHVLVRTTPKQTEIFGMRAMSREWESMGEKILLNLAAHDEKRLAMLLAKYPLVTNSEVRPRFHQATDPSERPPRPRNKR